MSRTRSSVVSPGSMATTRRPWAFQILDPEPRQPVPVFDDDRGDRRVRQQPHEPSPASVEARTDLHLRAHNDQPVASGPRGPGAEARHLAVEIVLLVPGGDAGVQGCASPVRFRPRVNQDRACRQLPCWHGEDPPVEPSPGRSGVYPSSSSPPRQHHCGSSSIVYRIPVWTRLYLFRATVVDPPALHLSLVIDRLAHGKRMGLSGGSRAP